MCGSTLLTTMYVCLLHDTSCALRALTSCCVSTCLR